MIDIIGSACGGLIAGLRGRGTRQAPRADLWRAILAEARKGLLAASPIHGEAHWLAVAATGIGGVMSRAAEGRRPSGAMTTAGRQQRPANHPQRIRSHGISPAG